ncbi:MAG: M14 family zinc carboxypeptidase [Gemmatimonadota bacterium]
MRRLVVVLLVCCLVTPLAAQQFDFYARGPYRAAVPRPETLLGYQVGSQQTMYHQQLQVLDQLIAAAPERVRTEVIGKTAEGKVMRILLISAPENLARLDEIRGNIAKLADPRVTSAAQAADLAQRTPAVVVLNHSVHGNEPAGFEAVMQTAYQLLASDEPATLDILKNLVVILNPSQNPDGHERFAAWYNSVAVGSDDPAALEQTEPWSIWGRYNHYRFDMNRDLLAQSQLETRALVGVLTRWRPQVLADLHSTTSQYFFPPVTQAQNQNLPPTTYKWFERFGRNNGNAFDSYGWQYYVRDAFDFFYPGYIDEWPTMSGAIGMTFESDGGPELKKRKDDGSYMTFEMGIAHHYIASLATLATAAGSRSELLRDYYDFHATALAVARTGAMRRVIFSAAPDPSRALWLAHLLVRQHVDVTRTTAPLSILRGNSYLGGTSGRRTFPAGSYVVDLAQPEGRLATAVLEPRATMDSGFVRAEIAKFERNRIRGEESSSEGYDFYDITAWALPLTLGLDAVWTDDVGAATGTLVTPEDSLPAEPAPGRAQSAYVFTNLTEAGARLAMDLLNEDFKVAVSLRPLVADGIGYPAGSFVVRVQRNPATVHDRVAALAAATGVRVTAVRSAFADTGAVGIGSEDVSALHAPKILLAADDGLDQTTFGDFWFYIERELKYPVTPVRLARIGGMELDRYNVLILPGGSPGRMWRELGEGGAARLKSWVESGGVIISIGDANGLLSRKELSLTTVREVGATEQGKEPTGEKDTTLSITSQPAPPLISPSASANLKPEYIPGSIFRATLDRSHWITLGYDRDQLPVFLFTSTLMTPSEKGDNPVAFVGSDLTLGGFTWPGNTEKLLKGSVWVAVENVGSGRVVLFADNPLFRGFWRGTAKLFTNALLFGTGR